MHIVSAIARHERRIRLVFDTALALAAFNTPSLYRVTNEDSLGASVGVVGLVMIAGQPQAIDLALGADLVDGALYAAHAAGVPAADASVSPPGTMLHVRLGATPAKPNVEVNPDDVAELLYGVDCVWSGGDYVESAAGDLASITGPENARAAIERRLQADGLPWDDAYGARPRAYVDGAPGALGTLKGALVRQARADDRVRSAKATLVVADDSASFDMTVRLIGADTVSVPLRVQTS
jgi:hypothetical protein